MTWRKIDIPTLLLVTIVTLLIWVLAEDRTHETSTFPGTVKFDVPGEGLYLINPGNHGLEFEIDGPPKAIQRMQRRLRDPILLPATARDGKHQIDDLASKIMTLDDVRQTGATIISTDPRSLEIDVTQLVTRTASVRAKLPNTSTVENVQVSQDVTITLPASGAERLPQPLVLDVVIPPDEIRRLEPGLHTLDGTVQLPTELGTFDNVSFDPPIVEVTFRLLSRAKSIQVERARIQLNSAAQDFGEYAVELPDQFLQNVTVEADAETIDQLESGECQLIAVVYLSTSDKERRVESKPVAYFTVLCRDGTGKVVTATVGDNPHPEVKMAIQPLASSPE